MSNQRYMMRGVSASKEDVHNAIKNIDKGIFPTVWAAIPSTVISCMPTAQEQNPAWPTCTGRKQVTSPFGKALHKMH